MYEVISYCPYCNCRYFEYNENNKLECKSCGSEYNHYDLEIAIVELEEEVKNVHNR